MLEMVTKTQVEDKKLPIQVGQVVIMLILVFNHKQEYKLIIKVEQTHKLVIRVSSHLISQWVVWLVETRETIVLVVKEWFILRQQQIH